LITGINAFVCFDFHYGSGWPPAAPDNDPIGLKKKRINFRQNALSDVDPRHAFGEYGESVAEGWLERQGLSIRDRRFSCNLGEIDLIAFDRKNDTWVFIEVKTRRRHWEQSALDSLTPAKQAKIVRTALVYLKMNGLMGQNVRFDVVTIEGGVLDWIPNAFGATSRYF
jgi:putative endonuclease